MFYLLSIIIILLLLSPIWSVISTSNTFNSDQYFTQQYYNRPAPIQSPSASASINDLIDDFRDSAAAAAETDSTIFELSQGQDDRRNWQVSTRKRKTYEATQLLDRLLSGYDARLRPSFRGYLY